SRACHRSGPRLRPARGRSGASRPPSGAPYGRRPAAPVRLGYPDPTGRGGGGVVAGAPRGPPRSGVAALVVRAPVLPRPKLDLPERERIARALADALLAELKGRKT